MNIQDALSLDLLHRDYPATVRQVNYACRGHCYVATEAAYHLFGKRAGFVPYVLRHSNGTHWWLKNESTGEILDPTQPQLGPWRPYKKGHRKHFLTPTPSTRELMRRIRAQSSPAV